MDPVTLIVGALAAGAVAGAKGTASEAVRDAHVGLKRLVRRRLAARPGGEVALAEHEIRPEQGGPALTAELIAVDAGADPALVGAAQRLMAAVDAEGWSAGRYRVTTSTTPDGPPAGDAAGTVTPRPPE